MLRNLAIALVASLFVANAAIAQTSSYRPQFKVAVKTATGTLDISELQNTIIHNTGAAGAIVLTLPTCANDTRTGASRVGLQATFYLTVAQDVDINPADADQILVETDAAGDAISSAATIGNRITLHCHSAGLWVPTDESGVWTDVN